MGRSLTDVIQGWRRPIGNIATSLQRLNISSKFTFVVGFAVIALTGILHHELWGDELQAWMLARDSTSALDLFRNMRLEGHPMLWHLLLLGITQISRSPFAMQLINLLIGIGAVYLVNYCSPFTTRQKFFLTFSYFILYEYTVISRSYGLGIALAFLFCALTTRSSRRSLARPSSENSFLCACILVALANTSLYGLLLSVALSIYLFADLNPRSGQALSIRDFVKLACRSYPLIIVTLGVGWLCSAIQILRALRPGILTLAPHSGRGLEINIIQEQAVAAVTNSIQVNLSDGLPLLVKLAHLTAYIWKSYVPIPQFENASFWNTSLFSDTPFLFGQSIPGFGGINWGQALSVLFSILLVFFVFKYCLRTPVARLMYAVGNILMFVVFYLFLPTGIRHHGHLFILLLLCLWLDNHSAKENELKSREQPAKYLSKPFLSAILAIHSLVGAYAYSMDLRHEFSGVAQAVNFIRSNNLGHLPIVGMRSWETSTFSGYLDRQIYYPELGSKGSFILPLPQSSLSEPWVLIRQFVSAHGATLVILDQTISIDQLATGVDYSVPNASSDSMTTRLLGKFDGAIVTKESYIVYIVYPK